MKVMDPGNINAQPTADAADHQLREVDVRAKLPVVHLDGGDAVGGLEVSITREGDKAILKEVVSRVKSACPPPTRIKCSRHHARQGRGGEESEGIHCDANGEEARLE